MGRESGRRGAPIPPGHRHGVDRRLATALAGVADVATTVVLLGLEDLDDGCWDVLTEAGLRLRCAADLADALDAVARDPAHVVIGDVRVGPELVAALRTRRDLATTHVILCVPLDAGDDLRAALATGADDVMRVPFEPEVLAARVAAGVRAGRLRANDALLRSLVANIPGAVYRCACDRDWTM